VFCDLLCLGKNDVGLVVCKLRIKLIWLEVLMEQEALFAVNCRMVTRNSYQGFPLYVALVGICVWAMKWVGSRHAATSVPHDVHPRLHSDKLRRPVSEQSALHL